MGLLKDLADRELWNAYFMGKIENKSLNKKEEEELSEYIEKEQYSTIVERMKEGNFCFSIPEKVQINKIKTGKKRVIYKFPKDEVFIMKMMVHLLYRYDKKMSPACYSFRKSHTIKMAINKIHNIRGLRNKYCVKADISNYFNSIPTDKLVKEVRNFINDDEELTKLLATLIQDNRAYEDGKLVKESRGAMAGMPLSAFFANLYLKSLDDIFVSYKIPYIRYSDDILFVVSTKEEVEQYKKILFDHIEEKGLTINPDKFQVMQPGEPFEFLGIKYENGIFDLAEVTKLKIKKKIKRRANSLYRWKKKNNVPFEPTARVLIRVFNYKFYDDWNEGDFTWSKYFFPLLNTSKGLQEVDHYFMQYIRFLNSGRHYKGNYKISYEKMKELGYRSLVYEYYKYKKSVENDAQ